MFTKERKKYLDSLSDISEIVRKEQPIKKEARKRKDSENSKKQNSKMKHNKVIVQGINKNMKDNVIKHKYNKKEENKSENKVSVSKKRGRPKKEVE
ncbi:hypothetical protein D3C72_2056900 [compost metagenome]